MKRKKMLLSLFLMLMLLPFLAPGYLPAKEYGSHKTEVREGEPRVTFVSYNLQTEIGQGELVSASIFFKVTKPLEKSEKVFFHLVKSGRKETSLNADFSPRYPTLIWDVNQVVEAGPFELAIPFNLEPGEYDVEVGLMEIVREESVVRYIREPYTNQEIKDFIIGKLTVTRTEAPEPNEPSEVDLTSFNDEGDIMLWEPLEATIKFLGYSDEDGQDTAAAEVTILPGGGYPGIMLLNFFNIMPKRGDWSLYDTLEMNLFIPTDGEGGGLRFQITDKTGRVYESQLALAPGKTRKLDLSMVELSGKIDISIIERIKLFLVSPAQPFTFYISRLKLISRGMPTGKPAVTFVRMEAPETTKRGQIFKIRMIFDIDQPIFQTHKMFVHLARVNDRAGSIGTDINLTPPLRDWPLNQKIGVDSAPLMISEEAPPGIYVVRAGLYLIAYTDGQGYVKMEDWEAYGGKSEVINIMQAAGPVDYIKQPYTNLDIQDWEVGTIEVQ